MENLLHLFRTRRVRQGTPPLDYPLFRSGGCFDDIPAVLPWMPLGRADVVGAYSRVRTPPALKNDTKLGDRRRPCDFSPQRHQNMASLSFSAVVHQRAHAYDRAPRGNACFDVPPKCRFSIARRIFVRSENSPRTRLSGSTLPSKQAT